MNVSGVLLYTAAMVIAGHGEENVIFVSIQKYLNQIGDQTI